MNALARYDGVFRVQDETNVTFTVKWQREPTRPTSNPAGTTGWALCGEKLLRLHVCANVPCKARYSASKYGHFPVPQHVRLIETAPVAATDSPEEVESILPAAPSGSIPAPAASESPAPVPDSLAPKVCPPVAVTAMAAVSPEPSSSFSSSSSSSPATALQAPAVAGPGAESKPPEEAAASKIAEKSQVAPPPPLAPKSLGTLAEDIPPQGGPHCYQCPALRLVRQSRVCLRSKWSNHPRWRG